MSDAAPTQPAITLTVTLSPDATEESPLSGAEFHCSGSVPAESVPILLAAAAQLAVQQAVRGELAARFPLMNEQILESIVVPEAAMELVDIITHLPSLAGINLL